MIILWALMCLDMILMMSDALAQEFIQWWLKAGL